MSAFCAPIQCTGSKVRLDVLAAQPASNRPSSSGWKVTCGDSKVQPEVITPTSTEPPNLRRARSTLQVQVPSSTQAETKSPKSSKTWATKRLDPDPKYENTLLQGSRIKSSTWTDKCLVSEVQPDIKATAASPIKSSKGKMKSEEPTATTEKLADTSKKSLFKTVGLKKRESKEDNIKTVASVPLGTGSGSNDRASELPISPPQATLSEMSKAIHSSILAMSTVGMGISNAFPPTPKPVKIWKKAVETADNIQLEQPEPGKPKTMLNLTGEEKKFVKSQPFKLVKAPPQLTPRQRFIFKAKQIANQPFKMYKPPPRPPSPPRTAQERMKKKAIGLSKMAGHPIFSATLKTESKGGRFQKFARAIAKTSKMMYMMDNIKQQVEHEEYMYSNEKAIKAGWHPLLKKEVLRHLFQYFSVADLKEARLVCEYWQRFSTPVLQKKSVVKLSGLCDICKSEWKLRDESMQPHDHAETISFYRFVLYIQDLPEEKRYFKPFRNFKLQNLNVYFIRGLSTAPTRVFLMFLKLWGDKIHEFHLESVQMCPPDSFYRVVDCCVRLNRLVLDDVRVWLNPLNEASALKFSMNINYYLTSITFLTNWVGEERLHWQMILQAFPCLQELNLVDVAKSEINHCLSAILSLPEDEEEEEEEEEMELQKLGIFKRLSRKVAMTTFNFKATGSLEETKASSSFKTLARTRMLMPYNMKRHSNESQEEQPEIIPIENNGDGTKNKLKGISRRVGKQPFRVGQKSPEPTPVGQINQGRLQKISKKIGGQPFRHGKNNLVDPKTDENTSLGKASEHSPSPSDESGTLDGPSSVEKIKKSSFRLPGRFSRRNKSQEAVSEKSQKIPSYREALSNHAKKSPFQLPVLVMAGDTNGTENEAEPEAAGSAAENSMDAKSRAKKALLDKAKISPFSIPLAKLAETKTQEEKRPPISFRAGVKRGTINQPFTLTVSSRNPEIIKPKKVTFKKFITPVMKSPFQLLQGEPKIKPVDMFRKLANKIVHQPFHLGGPMPHEMVIPGSLLRKVSIATRQAYEDHLRSSSILKKSSSEENTITQSSSESEGDFSLTGDEENSIAESDFDQMDTHELLAEIVDRFDISHLTLRVNYTREDVATFPLVLEACREKVECLTLTRHDKVYMPEMELRFLATPFQTPEETPMVFPQVHRLSIAHNFVDDINEIHDSFPALNLLSINIVLTEFKCRSLSYNSYVKTNLMISMKFGKPIPNLKTLVWNIHEARDPGSHKRTIVYKSNAIRHLPRVFPNISKLTVSVTTVHDLHVIFRHCLQLHDLVLLKNSFYRTKDDDIIGEYESQEEAMAREAGNLHPTRIRNAGIKQLQYLRRLSLENNNCCLTNRSIKYGFIHLRRLRSLHISRGRKITVDALKLLRVCRFLVHVSVTKDQLKMPQPHEDEDETNATDVESVTQVQQMHLLDKKAINPASCSRAHRMPNSSSQLCLARAPAGFQSVTKWDKIGGKGYHFVTTTYEVNGRTYHLTRRHYDDNAEGQQKSETPEAEDSAEDDDEFPDEEIKGADIDPMKIILRAEKRFVQKLIDEESDCEKFICDYDEDYETDEEGYNDKDDELLLYGKRTVEEDESSDEDGICPEDDSMYEGDKEFYLDTEAKTSDGDESYCDSVTEYEYRADKETSDEKPKSEEEDNGKAEGKTDDAVVQKQEELQAENENMVDDQLAPPAPASKPDAPDISPTTTSKSLGSFNATEAHTQIKIIINELTKELCLSKEKRKNKLKSKNTSTKCEKLQRNEPEKEQVVPLPLECKTPEALPNLPNIKEKVLSWQATEAACAEYEESLRRVSLSSFESIDSSSISPFRDLNQDESFDEFFESMISVPVHNLDLGDRSLRRNIRTFQTGRREGHENYSEKPSAEKDKKKTADRKKKKHKRHKSKSKHKIAENNAHSSISHIRTPLKPYSLDSNGGKEIQDDLRKLMIEKMVFEVKKDQRK